MRKVTASAVILTALTGCSQSSVPSTQWSFEVPSGDQADGIQRSADSSFATEISIDALTGDGQSQTGAMMGPAFAQPDADFIAAFDSESTTSQVAKASVDPLASGEFSALVTTATNPRTNDFIRSTARPDPIAQARSYLNRTSRPTAVISRVPYTSQVYLPSTAVAAPLSALGSVPTAPVVPSVTTLPTAPASQQSTNQSPVASWATTPSSPVASTPVASSSVASVPNSLPSLYQEGSVAEQESTPEAFVAQVPVVENDLPVLPPSENVVVQSDVPIGTSILQELQRNAGSSEPADPAVASQPDTQPDVVQVAVQPTPVNLVAAPTAIQATTASPETVAVQSVQQPPTLASLLAGLPENSQEPDITTFRQPVDSSRATEAANQVNPESAPAEATSAVFSPLLSGLSNSAEVSLSTLYVPVPDSEVADASAVFIQAAIAALEQQALSAAEIQNADRLARLLSSMQPSDQVPSLIQSVDLLPTEASAEENIQANSTKWIQPAEGGHSGSKANVLGKQPVRKYRQRISWQSATI